MAFLWSGLLFFISGEIGGQTGELKFNCLKAHGIAGGIKYGMVNVSVSQVVLNQTGINALICQTITTGMAQHVGMRRDFDIGIFTIVAYQSINLLAGDPSAFS